MSSTSTKTISVERRGSFHDDSFFRDSWNEWDRAMKDAVERWDNHTGSSHRTTFITNEPHKTNSVYRQIRSSNVTSDESQAVSCVEENERYKLVMDVKDFSPSDINVKAVDNTIVVEGKIVKTESDGTISTSTFVRRFHLPPSVNMAAVSSALSRDGILTISAPKLVSAITKGEPQTVPILRSETVPVHRSETTTTAQKPSYHSLAAGAPSNKDKAPFNPTGGSVVNTYYPDPKTRVTETITVGVPDRRGTEKVISTVTEKKSNHDNWDSFNAMVERSQREIEDMMKNHTISSSKDVTVPIANNTSALVSVPAGVSTNRDIIRSGNTVTERAEQRWTDHPTPGVTRNNRNATETSDIKDLDGNTVGNKLKRAQESKAEGEREEILPDGTKCKIFTKTYETKHSYQASSNGAKSP